jgi:hypothetical protein
MGEEMVYERAKQSVSVGRQQITLGLTSGSHERGLSNGSCRQCFFRFLES